jgi:hypothetical protein
MFRQQQVAVGSSQAAQWQPQHISASDELQCDSPIASVFVMIYLFYHDAQQLLPW